MKCENQKSLFSWMYININIIAVIQIFGVVAWWRVNVDTGVDHSIILVDSSEQVSVASVSLLQNRSVLALLVEIVVPAHATDRDDKRREKKYKCGDFQILILCVAVNDADENNRVAESDHAQHENPRTGQK